MAKTIIFDLDGTLVHSAPDLQAALNATLGHLGRDALDLDRVISFVGNGVEMLVKRGLTATGGCSAALLAEATDLFLQSYSANMTNLTHPYPGVLDTLKRLQTLGIPLGVCTNKPTGPAKAICDALGLSPYFHVIAGAQPDQPKKPDPAPLLTCIAALGGSQSDALYVGDSEIDYQTARNARVPFRLFSGGYLHHPLPDLRTDEVFDNWHHSALA
tara:strand:- start:1067 stop:1711 length:645 start_codon:yes stop_codon:yes gene_type:complete